MFQTEWTLTTSLATAQLNRYKFNDELQRVSNHPVHVKSFTKTGVLNPTALAPFCAFSGNMSVSFRPKIVKDQLCYTVNPNQFISSLNGQVELSLILFINKNEERHFESLSPIQDDSFSIIVETIG